MGISYLYATFTLEDLELSIDYPESWYTQGKLEPLCSTLGIQTRDQRRKQGFSFKGDERRISFLAQMANYENTAWKKNKKIYKGMRKNKSEIPPGTGGSCRHRFLSSAIDSKTYDFEKKKNSVQNTLWTKSFQTISLLIFSYLIIIHIYMYVYYRWGLFAKRIAVYISSRTICEELRSVSQHQNELQKEEKK